MYHLQFFYYGKPYSSVCSKIKTKCKWNAWIVFSPKHQRRKGDNITFFPIRTTQNQPVKFQHLTCSQLSHLLKYRCEFGAKEEDNHDEKMQLLAKLCIYLRQISSVNWSCLLKPIKHNVWPRVESRPSVWCYGNDSPVTSLGLPLGWSSVVAHRGRCFVCFVEWLITYFSMEHEIS